MTYPGGKNASGTYQKLINLMPPHSTYIEPFLGGGAVMRLKRPAAKSIGVDLCPEVIRWWKACIAGKSAPTGSLFRGMPPGWARSPFPAVLAGTCESGDAAGGIGVSGDGPRTPFPAMPAARHGVSGEARSLIVRRGDGIQFLEGHRFSGDELVYCDPPYLLSTRKGRRLYGEYELPDREHRRLLRCLLEVDARVMISGYPSEMYRRMLAGWNSIEFQAMTRNGTTATECVWFNFPKPVELHDYRYLGANFREREKINRMKRRWTARLAGMPPLKRQALLAAILEASPETPLLEASQNL